MFYFVYKTTNLVNSKFYYGVHQSEKLMDNYLGSGKLLNYAIKKYGKENFSREIIKFFDSAEQAYEFEKTIVTVKLTKLPECYNLCVGGYGGNRREGMTNSTEQRRKSSESQRGKKKLPGSKCGIYVRTDEAKLNIGNAVRGRFWVTDGVMEKQIQKSKFDELKLLGFFAGRLPLSEELKKRISETVSGRIHIHHPETKVGKHVSVSKFQDTYKKLGYIKGLAKK